MSCRCNAGSERSRRREIRKTYGWADPRQAQRHGTDGQRALARSLSTQWNCDEYFNGAQANRQMAGREGPALQRVRESADADVLRRMDRRKRRRAATRRFVAVAGHARAVERTQLNPELHGAFVCCATNMTSQPTASPTASQGARSRADTGSLSEIAQAHFRECVP